MLQEVLESLYNWFERDKLSGEFSIVDGKLDVASLQKNQYFRIVGSVFNDGLHKYPAHDLIDEKFNGEIWALAIPKEVIDISLEVKDWKEKYGEILANPYQSESFGGYSYSKKNLSGSATEGNQADWRTVFRSRLNKWRKLP